MRTFSHIILSIFKYFFSRKAELPWELSNQYCWDGCWESGPEPTHSVIQNWPNSSPPAGDFFCHSSVSQSVSVSLLLSFLSAYLSDWRTNPRVFLECCNKLYQRAPRGFTRLNRTGSLFLDSSHTLQHPWHTQTHYDTAMACCNRGSLKEMDI